MKLESAEVVEEVLAEMVDWLWLSPEVYRPAVILFSLRLPPHKLLEAFWIARNRMPDGGEAGFKYFCGVCHKMRRELSTWHARN